MEKSTGLIIGGIAVAGIAIWYLLSGQQQGFSAGGSGGGGVQPASNPSNFVINIAAPIFPSLDTNAGDLTYNQFIIQAGGTKKTAAISGTSSMVPVSQLMVPVAAPRTISSATSAQVIRQSTTLMGSQQSSTATQWGNFLSRLTYPR